MMTEGQALASFLEKMMGYKEQIKINNTIPKDATKGEMEKYCKNYACRGCNILQRCRLAARLYGQP